MLALRAAADYNSRHACLRADHCFRRVSALSNPAAHWQIHPALVRRRAGSVDDLPAVLPGLAARRLRLRSCQFAVSQTARASRRAFDFARRRAGVVANYTGRFLETD